MIPQILQETAHAGLRFGRFIYGGRNSLVPFVKNDRRSPPPLWAWIWGVTVHVACITKLNRQGGLQGNVVRRQPGGSEAIVDSPIQATSHLPPPCASLGLLITKGFCSIFPWRLVSQAAFTSYTFSILCLDSSLQSSCRR